MQYNRSKWFLKHYPGPFDHRQSTDGTENTFDVHCTRTNKTVISAYFWYEDFIPERDMRILSAALQSLHYGRNRQCDSNTRKLLEDFQLDYPGSFGARHIPLASWPAWEVFCKRTGQCVIFDPAECDEDHSRKLAEHIAFALNEFVSRA